MIIPLPAVAAAGEQKKKKKKKKKNIYIKGIGAGVGVSAGFGPPTKRARVHSPKDVQESSSSRAEISIQSRHRETSTPPSNWDSLKSFITKIGVGVGLPLGAGF